MVLVAEMIDAARDDEKCQYNYKCEKIVLLFKEKFISFLINVSIKYIEWIPPAVVNPAMRFRRYLAMNVYLGSPNTFNIALEMCTSLIVQ